MKILLDTNILVWFIKDDVLLSQKAREILGDDNNEIYYSVLSILEVEIKHTSHPKGISLSGEQLLNFCN